MRSLWDGIGVDYITTDCEAAMIKLGRLLEYGKELDDLGPALEKFGTKHNGCVGHRLDKMHGAVHDHPALKPLLGKLAHISTFLHKSSQANDYVKDTSKVAGGNAWTSIKAMVATRWWSLFDHLASFLENKETFVYLRDAPANSKSHLIPPDVHLLSDMDWFDIECIKDVVGPFKQAQQKLEGSKYITGSMVIPMLEEIRENLRSARMHYSVEQSPLGSAVVDAVIEAFNVRFGDGTEICVLKEGPARQPRGYTQEQVVATCLDARNVPSPPGIPPSQQPQAWALVRSLIVDHVHKERGGKPEVHLEGQSSTDEPDDWLSKAAAAAAAAASEAGTGNQEESAESIADREIKLWRMRAVPLGSGLCPLLEWKSAVKVCPWLGSLARRVLAIPATSAAPERLFSSSGNTMTKKRTRLTCDNLEELVFLHETWPVVREWEANKRVRMDEKAEEAVDLTNE